MEIKKIHQEFSVCQVEDYSFVNLDSEYSFIGKTAEEKSLFCLSISVPPNFILRAAVWQALRIHGVFPFSLFAFLSTFSAILAYLYFPFFSFSPSFPYYLLFLLVTGCCRANRRHRIYFSSLSFFGKSQCDGRQYDVSGRKGSFPDFS